MSRYESTGLYHGTRRPFTCGGIVLPGNEVGADNYGLERSDVVYVTPDLDLARAYAESAKGRGKPRVLEVRPLGDLYVNDSTVNGEDQQSYMCDSAFVVKVVLL